MNYARYGKRKSHYSAKNKKMLAFEALEELRKNSPFPKDFDYKTEIEQAIDEKYGYFN